MKLVIYRNGGFTLVENVVTLALVSLLSLSFINLAILAGKMARSAREQLTASEIIEMKLEAIRGSTWGQVTSANFVPTQFVVTNGAVYTGTITMRKKPVTETYGDSLVEVIVAVRWNTDRRPQHLQMTTWISPYGFFASY